MSYFQLENFFSNFSFLILFISMIYYWINIAFNLKNKNLGTFGMILANFSIFTLLILRWKESGHFPLSNLYESFLFLSWNLTLIHLILEKITPFSNKSEKFLGAITSPTALFTNAFATFSLPEDMRSPSPLVPALQSNWLMMHVTVMILSYSALICGSLLSIAYLIITFYNKNTKEKLLYASDNIISQSEIELVNNIYKQPALLSLAERSEGTNAELSLRSASEAKSTQKKKEQNVISNENLNNSLSSTSPISTNSKIYSLNFSNNLYNTNLNNINVVSKKIKLADDLDNLSYRILGVGFPLLTIGILSGAVWANEAWGSYWSWDPKETWALLTWLVFAIYLHTRIIKGWQGKNPAIIASLGFFVVWICFLGVNLLGEGLHSYGFIKMNG
uniref:Cytochrome c biogenesis protein CcsA n=1 Tax=Pseudopediastrum integrum TaxID=271402 RepID=A0A2U8GJH9_9CHLO|nr:heme attachment to plastid cytochrome c [Pseudopediastrum integrum]AWI68793.1 heme attachment to plastid cytochrome c [Pseudopediastrum integrum]